MKASNWIARKRRGDSTSVEPRAPKYRRLKTFTSMVSLNNLIQESTAGKSLQDFIIETDTDGAWRIDPFKWPRLELAPDMGPDKVCQGG